MAYTPDLYNKCKEELTYKIPSKNPKEKPVIKTTLKVVGERFLSLPSGRVDLIPEGYNIIDKRSLVPVNFPEFKFTLRPDQKEVYDQIEDCCLINANVSWGEVLPSF
jgi:hypothetical protein